MIVINLYLGVSTFFFVSFSRGGGHIRQGPRNLAVVLIPV